MNSFPVKNFLNSTAAPAGVRRWALPPDPSQDLALLAAKIAAVSNSPFSDGPEGRTFLWFMAKRTALRAVAKRGTESDPGEVAA